MVKKFLTREQTYSQLLFNVNDSERKIEKVQADNDMLRSKLHELKIDSEAHKDASGAPEDRFQDEDILEMRASIADQKKQMSMLQEKYKKINIVNDQVSLLENLPVVGHACLQEEILRFVASVRNMVERRSRVDAFSEIFADE